MRSFKITVAIVCLLVTGATASATDLFVYGPGGPLPAMKEAAEMFGKSREADVSVTAGPTPSWIEKAKSNADLVFSGSEAMMTDFVVAMEGRIVSGEVRPLYLRPSAILVRPGNPRKIHGLADLMQPGHRVLVVNGAGQEGLWEDMAGRTGEIEKVRALLSNIVAAAPNTAAARKSWIDDPTLDAWIVWNIWGVANPDLTEIVEVEPEYRIYRDAGIVLTGQGKGKPLAEEFVKFLEGPEGKAIFAKWGWKTD